jgi:hypothetical protein
MAIEVYPKKPVSRPHTSITVDTSGIGGSAGASDKILMLIGSAKGGTPSTVYKVTNYQQAKQVFRSGELLDAMELAWNPSADGTESAGAILAMRVEDATQATLTQGALTITSQLYGVDANQIQMSLEDNSLTKTKRLTLAFATDKVNKVFDNLGKIFKIEYSGEESAAQVTVEADEITKKATKLVLSTGTAVPAKEAVIDTEGNVTTPAVAAVNPTVVKEYKLGSGVYNDIYALISDINNIEDFEATFFPIGDKNIQSDLLEPVDNVAIKGTDVYLESMAGDIAKQLDYNGYVDIVVDPTKEVTNFALTNLSGGTDGSVPESWADKLKLFANEGGYYLVPLTDNVAVHSEVLAFVKDRSDMAEPMRAFVGGGVGESLEEQITRATRLRDARIAIMGASGKRVMDDGRELHLPAYMLAAQVAGYASGIEIGEAVTFKPFALTSLDTILDSTQLDQLNENGVISLEFVRNRTNTMFRIVEDVTTYNDTTDPVKSEISVGEANDFLVSELKIALDNQYIGTKVVETSASLIKNFIQSFLDQKKRDSEIQGYPAEDVQVVLEGDEAYISFTVYPTRSLNKIEVTITYQQQTISA